MEREVMGDTYDDTTLVLIGHGSTLNADSATPTYRHLEAIRAQGIFSDVVAGFWKQEPGLAGVLRGVYTSKAFIVPLFISDGYFTEEVIPREMGFSPNPDTGYSRILQKQGQTFVYCGPVGTHDSMTSVLIQRAKTILEQFPFPRAPKPEEVALFIAGHGTGNNENSRKAIERQVDLIRATGIFNQVESVFMEEDPRVGDCYQMAKSKSIVMVPFFISDGLHSFEDIPVLLGESETTVRKRLTAGQPTWRNPTEKHGKLLWYTPSIGTEPLIVDVILERVREGHQLLQEEHPMVPSGVGM